MQLLLLSSISEIYQQNWASTIKIVSYLFAILVLVLCIGILILTTVVSLKRATHNLDRERSKFDELFSGIRQSRLAYMYNVVLISRRLLFITWLLCMEWAPPMLVVCVFATMQLIYTLWAIYVRYFDIVKDNIVEIYNECIYLTMLVILGYYRKEDRWNQVLIYLYMALMMSCALFLLVVSIGRPIFIYL